MLETSMDVDASIDRPNGGPETLDSSELVPFRGLGIVHFECNIFSNLICATTDDHHERPKEQRRMLITRGRRLASLVRGFDPVPTAISVTAQSPGVA